MEQTHPDIKHARYDFVMIIKRAEHKPGFRQPRLPPRLRSLADRPPAIVRLVTVRQVNNFLCVKAALAFRDDNPIREDVIDVIQPHRAWISLIVDLNRRGTKRQYSGS